MPTSAAEGAQVACAPVRPQDGGDGPHLTKVDDLVLLVTGGGKRHLLRLKAGRQFHSHLGQIKHDDLLNLPYGTTVYSHLGHALLLLEPSLDDRITRIKRNTQIIYPKDAAMIVQRLNLRAGSRVIEAGTGSGGLAIALAWSVAPSGRVYSYELRDEHVRVARSNLEKMGLHSGDTSELFFEDMRVSAADILGGEGQGFANLMNELPRERLILGVGCVAAADGIFDTTVAYVTERKAFGGVLSNFQNTRYKLADMKTEIELNRALAEKYIERFENGELTASEASLCKLAASEMQGRIADQCLQLFGGYGYMREYKISRFYLDARIQRIYGGTSEIMKELIARSVVDR